MGKEIHSFIELQSVDSTNLYTENLLKIQKVAEGTIVFAHAQTAGKGQGANSWESEPGKNATFSLLLRPVFLHPGEQFLLNKAITLGLLDFLSLFQNKDPWSVKWPNDIYAGDRKIGGILIQNTMSGTVYETCIAGIGVNINQETFPSTLPNPVSLKQITGIEYPVPEAVDKIVKSIMEYYHLLKTGSYGIVNLKYRDHLLGIGEWRNYIVNNLVIKGKIRNVDETGMLIMELENKQECLINHGEIEFVFH